MAASGFEVVQVIFFLLLVNVAGAE